MEWLWLALLGCVIGLFFALGLTMGLVSKGSFTTFFIALSLFGVSVFGSMALYHPHIPYFLFFLVPAPILFGATVGTFYRLMAKKQA